MSSSPLPEAWLLEFEHPHRNRVFLTQVEGVDARGAWVPLFLRLDENGKPFTVAHLVVFDNGGKAVFLDYSDAMSACQRMHGLRFDLVRQSQEGPTPSPVA